MSSPRPESQPPQQQTPPGTLGEMTPQPDHGEESYRGSGRLTGKKAIITGGDSGIGRAVALAFAREGADVLIAYLDEHEDAKKTGQLVTEAGRKAALVAGDIGSEAHCQALVERFGGEVPRCMDEMLTLPGVARKTANVVLNMAYRLPSGVIVDSHVARVSQRMGLAKSDKPEKIELELMQTVPQTEWIQFGAALVLHGRYVCTARKPNCPECDLNDLCPKIGVGEETTA